jgi:3-demethoxyubiquinol 3-hydroxylase
MGFDSTLQVLIQRPCACACRVSPADTVSEGILTISERRHSAGLMRVNYVGELCAQALYHAQALHASQKLQSGLKKIADEESDHLTWCAMRLDELNSRTSYLNIFWYAGAWVFGLLASLCGDSINLGFLAETEKQVVQHLESHLIQLPQQDEKSRRVISVIRDEELQHAHLAQYLGATSLPPPIIQLMYCCAKVMTTVAYWI